MPEPRDQQEWMNSDKDIKSLKADGLVARQNKIRFNLEIDEEFLLLLHILLI